MVSSTGFSQQPHRRRRRVGALHAGGDERRRADLPAAVLLYQGWTYHVFRARVGGERPGRAAGAAPPAAPPTVATMRALDPRLAPARPAGAARCSRPTSRSASARPCSCSRRPRSCVDRRPRVRRRAARRRRAGRSSCSSLVFAARAALAWGFEVAGRRAAAGVLSELRLGSSSSACATSRARSTAPTPPRSRPPRAGRRRARGVLRPLPAAARARRRRAGRRARLGRRRSISSRPG